MTATRTRKATKSYDKYLRQSSNNEQTCEFCQMKSGHPQFVRQGRYFKIIRVKFPYSLWDDTGVSDHLMLVPTAHVENLAALPQEAAKEFMISLAEYEGNGYNVYARAPQSKTRSVAHQHTHLIKSSGPRLRFLFFMRRPYVRLSR
jgi:diadenosine tetraphosphate (Ap4A) HIT family hydrolase